VTRRLSMRVRLALAGLWASMVMLGLASGLGVLGLPDTVPSAVAQTTTTTTSTTTSTKAKCNSGNGNGQETTPENDCDPGNSGGHNSGGG
jgi:hypothetical protein